MLPAGLRNAVEFDHSLGHHHEVGHHIVPSEEAPHRREEVADAARAGGNHVLVGGLRLDAPMPRVVERLNLRRREFAARLAEEHVVGGVRVERRVEVDEVNALARDMLAQDRQVVAEEEFVAPVGHRGMLAEAAAGA